MASSSSSSSPIQHKKYDVSLSFGGEETRENLISHLHAALCQHGICTFIDDDLEIRGKEARRAIEESKVAVVVFSKDYVSSICCLDQLENIMECHETGGLMVIPVFYLVDPLDVVNQSGAFAEVFARHEEDHKEEIHKVKNWRVVLTKAANLPGWDSKVIRPKPRLVHEIVEDISGRLQNFSASGLEGLVGIVSRVEEIEAMLSTQWSGAFILGLWGMAGAGKTTLAGAVFKHMAWQFQGSCFLSNVREKSERSGGLTRLAEELLSETLDIQDVKLRGTGIGSSYFKNMLRRKKIFIVLDDVNNLKQLECLVGDCTWFGSGSRIIITSRDKQVLSIKADSVFEVQELAHPEALRLFSRNAFKQELPTRDFADLSNLILKYAMGNPLALKVLGSSLYEREKREWESALRKLEKFPKIDVQDVLKLSYNCLDWHEKEIFLHIACFFKGRDRDQVTEILNACGFSADSGLVYLVDKSLIYIFEDIIQMDYIVQEMGREIVRQESTEPGKRSRLWDHEEIYHVLTENTGTEAIEAISLDVSKIREIHLNPDAFARMPNLKFLRFYAPSEFEGFTEDCKVHLSQGLDSLPNKLRYLCWYRYPLRHLPASFKPTELVELMLPQSNLKRLWKDGQNHEKLKVIDLSYSRFLKKIPDLPRNLMRLHLNGCASLLKVPPSIGYLSKLTRMLLRSCENISDLPNTFELKCLETLDLSGCSNLAKFPEISRNISCLYLDGTAIKEVPPSVDCLTKLSELYMRNCTLLESLPSSISKCQSLKRFDLSGCLSLEEFPDIPVAMDGLERLFLDRTAIKELPSSIENLKGLFELDMTGCNRLASLPQSFHNLPALNKLRLSDCSRLEYLPKNFQLLGSLENLKANGCYLSELPTDWSKLSSITVLDLSGNRFERMPHGLKQLSALRDLTIRRCERLRSLPELPASLKCIDAHECRSLESISGLTQLFKLENIDTSRGENFIFSNCFKLDQNEWTQVVSDAKSRIQRFARGVNEYQGFHLAPFMKICYPGGGIPEWFTNQSEGNSVRVQLPPHWHNHRFLGFALCAVLVNQDDDHSVFSLDCNGYTGNNDLSCSSNQFQSLPCCFWDCEDYKNLESEHVILWYNHDFSAKASYKICESGCSDVSFEFGPDDEGAKSTGFCKVKRCGVFLVYADDGEEVNRLKMPQDAGIEEDVMEARGCKRHQEDPNYNGQDEDQPYGKKLKQLRQMMCSHN